MQTCYVVARHEPGLFQDELPSEQACSLLGTTKTLLEITKTDFSHTVTHNKMPRTSSPGEATPVPWTSGSCAGQNANHCNNAEHLHHHRR